MKFIWKLQDAKARFSQVVHDSIKKGPQFITRHGKETAVLLSIEDYNNLTGEKPDFKNFLLNIPRVDGGLSVERDSSQLRDIEL